MDGTLLNSRHHVSAQTAAKLRALRQSGVPFVAVSARMPPAVYPILEETGLRGPAVCYGGALTLDENRRPVRSLQLNARDTADVLDFMTKHYPELVANLYEADVWYSARPQDPIVKEESEITAVTPRAFPEEGPGKIRPHKIFYMAPPQQADEILEKLRREFPRLNVFHSGWGHLEIMDKHALKSEGLKSVCEYLHIPVQNAVAFGDSPNDMDMLRAAGLGVAVANAAPEVKEAADEITASNDQDGVLKTLQKLFP